MRSYAQICTLIYSIAFINAFRFSSQYHRSTTTQRFANNNENNSNQDSNRLSKRRSKSNEIDKLSVSKNIIDEKSISALLSKDNLSPTSTNSNTVGQDGTSSLEDLFGLGDDQLTELLETELPVPREDLITGQAVVEEEADKNKVFQLPDLNEFVNQGNEKSNNKKSNRKQRKEEGKKVRIDRRNQEEYMRVMQLNPFADADESNFLDEVSLISYTYIDTYINIYIHTYLPAIYGV